MVSRVDSAALASNNLPRCWVRVWLKDLRRGHQGRKGSPQIHSNSWALQSVLSASQQILMAYEIDHFTINQIQGDCNINPFETESPQRSRNGYT